MPYRNTFHTESRRHTKQRVWTKNKTKPKRNEETKKRETPGNFFTLNSQESCVSVKGFYSLFWLRWTSGSTRALFTWQSIEKMHGVRCNLLSHFLSLFHFFFLICLFISLLFINDILVSNNAWRTQQQQQQTLLQKRQIPNTRLTTCSLNSKFNIISTIEFKIRCVKFEYKCA